MEDLGHGPDARDSLLRESDHITLSMAVTFSGAKGKQSEMSFWGLAD